MKQMHAPPKKNKEKTKINKENTHTMQQKC